MAKKRKSQIVRAEPPTTSRSAFTLELAAAICEEVANGKPLKDVCELPGMPSRRTVYYWLAQHAEFATMYDRARIERTDLIADEIISIADSATNENVWLARVKIDARKWWAARVNPKSYGDKASIDVKADHNHHHEAESVSATADWVAGLLRSGANGSAQKPTSH